MRLRILRRHINKAIIEYDTKSILMCCPIWQAVHEKFPDLSIRCFHIFIDSDFHPIFHIDEDGRKITRLIPSEWKTLKSTTITLTQTKEMKSWLTKTK